MIKRWRRLARGNTFEINGTKNRLSFNHCWLTLTRLHLAVAKIRDI